MSLGRGLSAGGALCPAWSVLAFNSLQRSLPAIEDCGSHHESPGLQENGDAFLGLSFSNLLAKSGTDGVTGVRCVVASFPSRFPICSSYVKLGASVSFGGNFCAYWYMLLLLSLSL